MNIKNIYSIKLKAQKKDVLAFNFQLVAFSFLLLAFSFQLSANVVSAQPASLSIRPSIISLFLSPGKTTNTALSIINNSDRPLPVRLTFEPLTLTDSSDTVKSIGSWISLSNNSLLIPAQKETSVNIKITLPKTIPLGGYYGMLYVEQLSPTQNSSGSLILTKMGVLILGSVGVQDVPLNSIELQNPTLTSIVSESNIIPLSLQVKNTALNHISAKPYLNVHPLFEKTETIQLEEKLVFPGTKRNWATSFTVKNDHQFYYTADLYVSIGNGLSQKKSFSFIIFPVKQAIILVLCIALGVSILRKRKQIKKAFEIMIRG